MKHRGLKVKSQGTDQIPIQRALLYAEGYSRLESPVPMQPSSAYPHKAQK